MNPVVTAEAAAGPIPAVRPDWPAAPPVGAAFSLRGGGVSAPPFDSLNLGAHVGDDPAAVAENRRRLRAALGLVTPDHGTIRVLGAPPRRGNPAIGYIPQSRRATAQLRIAGPELMLPRPWRPRSR